MRIPAGKTFAVLVAASATIAGAAEVDRTFEQRFDVKPGARLALEHEDGKVVVTPWEEDAIEVKVRYKVEYRRVGVGSDPDLEVRFEQRGDVVEVVGEEQTVGGIGFFSVDVIEHVYRVQAPSYVELDLDGDDGDVEITGWRAPIRVENDDGNVRLEGVHARVRVDVEDGDVEIEDAEGELTLQVGDGDVTVRRSRSDRMRIDVQDGRVRLEECIGSFDISSDDGDVDLVGVTAGKLDVQAGDGRVGIGLEGALGELDLDVHTDDGDVELDLGAAVSGFFTLTSDDGGIRVDAAAADVEKDRRRVTGRLGEGPGQIRVSSNGGRISLRQGI